MEHRAQEIDLRLAAELSLAMTLTGWVAREIFQAVFPL